MAIISNQRTVVGTIVDVYEVRNVGKDNISVVNFRLAVTPSVKDGNGGWTDGETDWVDVTAWRRLADNVAKTFNKGDRVIVIGSQTIQPARTGNDGKEYPAKPIINAEFVGVDLTFDPASSDRKGTATTAKGSATDDEKPATRRKSSSKRRDEDEEEAPAPKARKKKPAPKVEEDDEFEDFGDEFDSFDDDDDEDTPF